MLFFNVNCLTENERIELSIILEGGNHIHLIYVIVILYEQKRRNTVFSFFEVPCMHLSFNVISQDQMCSKLVSFNLLLVTVVNELKACILTR